MMAKASSQHQPRQSIHITAELKYLYVNENGKMCLDAHNSIGNRQVYIKIFLIQSGHAGLDKYPN